MTLKLQMPPEDTLFPLLLFAAHFWLFATRSSLLPVTVAMDPSWLLLTNFPLKGGLKPFPCQLLISDEHVNGISVQYNSLSFLFPFPSWQLLQCLPDTGLLENEYNYFPGKDRETFAIFQ